MRYCMWTDKDGLGRWNSLSVYFLDGRGCWNLAGSLTQSLWQARAGSARWLNVQGQIQAGRPKVDRSPRLRANLSHRQVALLELLLQGHKSNHKPETGDRPEHRPWGVCELRNQTLTERAHCLPWRTKATSKVHGSSPVQSNVDCILTAARYRSSQRSSDGHLCSWSGRLQHYIAVSQFL